MKRLLILALALGCAGADGPEDGLCRFDGTYEIGLLPTNGCAKDSQKAYLHETSECNSIIDTLAADGSWRKGLMSCNPNGHGGQVVECDGFVASTDGCDWDAYMRRVSP